jgi:hypothetical protein
MLPNSTEQGVAVSADVSTNLPCVFTRFLWLWVLLHIYFLLHMQIARPWPCELVTRPFQLEWIATESPTDSQQKFIVSWAVPRRDATLPTHSLQNGRLVPFLAPHRSNWSRPHPQTGPVTRPGQPQCTCTLTCP